MSATTPTLPGLEVDPHTLPPIRPSYAKLVRQLQAAAEHHRIPVRDLRQAQLESYGAHRGWSRSTQATLRRVAHAHGLDIDPALNNEIAERANVSLAPYTSCSPIALDWQKRIAALAAITWHYPATLNHWTTLLWSDVQLETTPVVDGRPCPGTLNTLATWRAAVIQMHPGIPDDRLPLFVRLDGALLAAGQRVLQIDWKNWFGEPQPGQPRITFDRFRAWAVDAGATPVDRGAKRSRYVGRR